MNSESISRELDLNGVKIDDWRKSDYPIGNNASHPPVEIVFDASVLKMIHGHGAEDTKVEICGVLVGQKLQDERGPFLHIQAMVRGEYSENQLAQVTFTSETWNHIHDEIDKFHQDKIILGWYHTHPGFGIFLSPMDLFIHESFFNADEQLAYVYDPVADADGLFTWSNGEVIEHPFHIRSDIPYKQKKRVALFDGNIEMTAAGTSGNDLDASLIRVGKRQIVMFAALCINFLLLMILSFFLYLQQNEIVETVNQKVKNLEKDIEANGNLSINLNKKFSQTINNLKNVILDLVYDRIWWPVPSKNYPSEHSSPGVKLPELNNSDGLPKAPIKEEEERNRGEKKRFPPGAQNKSEKPRNQDNDSNNHEAQGKEEISREVLE